MPAPILSVDPRHPQPRQIDRAVAALAAGGLIAYPTDTYYGLGCDLFAKKAIARLYALKPRDRKKPFSIICPDLSDVARYAKVSNSAYRFMKHHTPGPFTFVLEATRLVPRMMITKQKQVGIRVPDSPVAIVLARGLGKPIVNTSAAYGVGEPLSTAQDIQNALGAGLDLVLDGGILIGEPSTVVSLLGDEIQVLRQGKGQLIQEQRDSLLG
jgi:tRNA threonylcarbamoyl adenosine modification protein (Sua5/YciO/YrdC/YwlC family)